MTKRNILITCLLLLLALGGRTPAQEQSSSSEQAASESGSLRRKLEEQAAQIHLLRQTLQQQSELIERQQRQVDDLLLKTEQLSITASTSATIDADAPMVDAATASAPQSAPVQPDRKSADDPTGKIKFNGLIQGWFAAGNGGFSDTFRVRRAELKLSGAITPKANWTVSIDAAKALALNNNFMVIGGERALTETSVNQAGRILQDAYVTLGYFNHGQVDVGQFKVPLSLEGLQSSATLDTVERALFLSDRLRGGSYGDVRDIGVMARGPLSKHANYQIGLFNGSGESQNDLDKNDQKTLAGRLVARPPFAQGLQIGASGTWGGGTRPNRPRRNRLGAELLYVRPSLLVKSELMNGMDSGLHRLGYYVHLGYRLRPRIEAILRLDSWDPDTRFERDATEIAERDYLAGLNYYIKGNDLKIQVNYLRKSFAQRLAPRNVLLINLQTSW